MQKNDGKTWIVHKNTRIHLDNSYVNFKNKKMVDSYEPSMKVEKVEESADEAVNLINTMLQKRNFFEIKGDVAVLTHERDTYTILLSDFENPYKAIDTLIHLLEKDWMTKDRIEKYLREMKRLSRFS